MPGFLAWVEMEIVKTGATGTGRSRFFGWRNPAFIPGQFGLEIRTAFLQETYVFPARNPIKFSYNLTVVLADKFRPADALDIKHRQSGAIDSPQ